MLYCSFVDWKDLLLADDQIFMSYIDAFRACNRSHTCPRDFYASPEAERSDSDTEIDDHPQKQVGGHRLVDFETFARRRPLKGFTRTDLLNLWSWTVVTTSLLSFGETT